MRNFWYHYKSTILLLTGVILGGVMGMCCPGIVPWLKPMGDIFLNLMFVLIVPMVFLSMATSICTLHQEKMVGSVLGKALIGFVLLAVVTSALSLLACRLYTPMDADAGSWLAIGRQPQDIGTLITGALTVSDFWMLLDKQHLLPLIIMAVLTGVAVSRSGDKGQPVAQWLASANDVVMQMVKMIMMVAPIGLGCYFAHVMSQMGTQLISGYARIMALGFGMLAVLYILINPLYILIRCGKSGFVAYWRYILNPTIMAVATCSSSATMPFSIEAAKRMGAEERIANSVIPLGTNIFKQGSIMTCTLKIVFTMLLAGMSMASPLSWVSIMCLAVLAACVVSAVPSGAMTGELFICAMLGVDPKMVGILVVMATLLDIPGTLMNVVGNITVATTIKVQTK